MSIAFRKTDATRSDHRLSEFAEAVIAGLSSNPKTLPCRFFYDARGSDLFEEITRLPEYYPTRVETGILERGGAALIDDVAEGATLVEFGSGSSIKTEMLLRNGRISSYVPIDVSQSALAEAEARLRLLFPGLDIQPLVADFTADIRLPPLERGSQVVGFFPGSTIGNFTPGEARDLLRHMARLLGPGSRLVIGVDLQKKRETLVAAYDDSAGVTAAFNLNLLHRMRRELGARVNVENFGHRAVYNETEHRIEMHLVSRETQAIEVAGESFSLAQGETIHTENSCKYTPEGFADLAAGAGWRVRRVLTDDERLFSVMLLEAD
ncbi:MAG: L-histidine N(alpha)-methyltransferase [Hyphomicrobiales bacterium]|nr:L-histidine N(alpha)-methyltransferase [Hyphomicrobiales bacterium]